MSYADAIKKQAEAKPVAPKPAAEPVAKKAAAAPAPVAPVAAPKAEKKKVEKKAAVEEEVAPKVAEEAVTLPLDIGVAASPWTAMARKPATAKPAPVPEKAEKKKSESEDRTVEKAEKVEKTAASSKAAADDSEVKASKPRREAGERSGKKSEKKTEKKSEEKPAAVEPVVPEVSKPLEIAAVPAAGAWGKATIVSVIAAKKAEVVVAPTPAPKKSRKGAAHKEAAPVAAATATEVAPATEKAAPVVEESAPVAVVAAVVEETKSSEIADDASLEIEGTADVVEIDVEARALPQTPLSEADVPIAVLEPLHKDGDARAETPVAPIVPVAVSPVKLSTEQDQQLQKGTTVTLPVGHQKFVQPTGTFTFIGTLPAEPVAAPVEPVRAAPVRTAAPVSSTPAHHQTAAPHYNAHNNSMNTYHNNNAAPASQYNAAPQQHQVAGANAGGGYQRNGTMYFDSQYNNNSSYNNAPSANGYQGHNNVSSIGRGGYGRGGYHSDVPRPNYEGRGGGGGYEGGRGGYNAYRGGGGAPRYDNNNSGYYPPVQNNYNSAPVSHHSHHHDASHQQYNNAPVGGGYGGSRYNNNNMAPPAHPSAYRGGGGGTNYPVPHANSYTRGMGRGRGGQAEPSAITSPGLFTGQQYGNNQDYHHQPQQYGHHNHQRAPQYSSAPPPSQGYNSQGY